MFIVVVGVGLAGVLAAINMGAQHSSDPMVRKQAVAAAESLLEEVELQPFTFCDPSDTAAATATSSAGCSTTAQSMDTPANWGAGESRFGPVFFDNVADYINFAMNGSLTDVFQQASSRLSGYSATVSITQVGSGFGVANTDVLRIDVTVTGNGNAVTLTGFRFRHSPNLVD
ncbi:MAG: type II secretion system protein [Betaproteobacteria bacterium]